MKPLTLVIQMALMISTVGLLTGCNSARAGVGLPNAFIYENTKVPMTAKRPERGSSGLDIPKDLRSSEVETHQIELSIPGLLPPGVSDFLSVGWGDMSTEQALKTGDLPEVLYADAHKLSILGIYTRVRVVSFAKE